MTETYLSLGPTANLAFMGPIGLAVIAMAFFSLSLGRRRGISSNSVFWPMLAWGIWTIVVGFARFPVMWGTAALPIALAIGFLFPTKAISPLARGIFIPFFLLMGSYEFSMQAGEQRIVLGPIEAQYTAHWFHGTANISRNDLLVKALRNVRTDSPGDYGWMVQPARGIGMPSPDFRSHDLFWGPRGLIRGDQLANRIANWAGVKPSYENYSM